MSVLCCHIPDFLIKLSLQRQAPKAGLPMALLGPDDRVRATSPAARKEGVRVQMSARQAQVRCPDLQMELVDNDFCEAEQQLFLATLSRWGLPVEAHNWGMAYVALQHVVMKTEEARPMLSELGRMVRDEFGEDLQPALGWDSSKFTARAASACAEPGHMRLIGKSDEATFLAPLPINLLPLPHADLQQLDWLGIRTLGQFAALPTGAVQQRFGKAGKVALRWARGKDNRPVQDDVAAVPEPVRADLDPPTGLLHRVLAMLEIILQPELDHLANHLQGCRRLRIQLDFVEGSRRTLDIPFVDPTSQSAIIRDVLADRLLRLNWPAEVDHVAATVMATGELNTYQPTLFPELAEESEPAAQLARKLSSRYGSLFFQGRIVDDHHPLAERRTRLLALP